MFINYKIVDNVLFLEMNINYEFGGNKKRKTSFIDAIKNYLNKENIKSKFSKIVITCSGIVIGSIVLLNDNEKIVNDNIKYIPNLGNTAPYIYKERKIENESAIEEKNENINDSFNNESKNTNNIEKNEVKIDKKEEKIEKNEENSMSNTADNNSKNMVTQPSVSEKSMISVKRSNGSTINIELNDYLVGVIAAEMPASFNSEALKAQAVISRTYALKAKENGKILTDDVSTQAYIDENEMKNKWGSSFNAYYNKIKNAVESTKDEYLSYNGNYIEALYHSTNNGKTESSLDVFGNYYPYLTSVTSEFDKSASSYLRVSNIDINTFSSKLGINLNENSTVEIISYTDGNNIREINIGGKTFTGKYVRETLGLRSADFDINMKEGTIEITTRGYGHGVGMSQYGANGMANAGYNYKDILSHYYPGTTLAK